MTGSQHSSELSQTQTLASTVELELNPCYEEKLTERNHPSACQGEATVAWRTTSTVPAEEAAVTAQLGPVRPCFMQRSSRIMARDPEDNKIKEIKTRLF